MLQSTNILIPRMFLFYYGSVLNIVLFKLLFDLLFIALV